MFESYRIPLDKNVTDFVNWLVENYRPLFQSLKWPIDFILTAFESLLVSLHPLVIITFFCFLSWKFKSWKLSLMTLFSFLVIGFLGLWGATMQTLSMVLSSVFICVLIGLPLGILSTKLPSLDKIIRPIMDAMQTTPAFVYLVPIVMLFSIGNVAGVIATVVFALPPMIRLTALGLKQVDKELVEAAQAFGANPWQLLLKVQLPLAKPSIMAGLNQTIMMSLSMVVIASLIGAGGLGNPVVQGLNTLDIGLAVNGGLGIVILAITIDRITFAMAEK